VTVLYGAEQTLEVIGVPTKSQLQQLDVSSYGDGTLAYVAETASFYSRQSLLGSNGGTILKSAGPGGWAQVVASSSGGMPAGATQAYDALVIASITKYVYGAQGTNEGQLCTAAANLGSGGGSATQPSPPSFSTTCLHDELNLAGQPAFVFGNDGDNLVFNDAATTALSLPSLPWGLPFTLFVVGRGDTGTLFELGAGVASNPGMLMTTTTGPSLAINRTGSSEETANAYLSPSSLVTALGASVFYTLLETDSGVTVDGSNNISAWADQSGNGNGLSQATAGNRIPFVSSGGLANGKPYLNCTATSGQTIAGTFSVPLGYEVAIVCTQANSNTLMTAFDTNGGNSNAILSFASSNFQIFAGFNNTNALNVADGGGIPHMFAFAAPVAQNATAQVDGGVLIASGTGVATALTNVSVGSAVGGGEPWYGQIYAVCITKTLTAAQRLIRDNYLTQKYGCNHQLWASDDGCHTWIVTSNGTDPPTITRDGQALALTTNAVSPGTGTATVSGMLGASHALSAIGIGAIARWYLYSSVLSGALLAQGLADCQAKWPSSPTTSGPQTVKVLEAGDSITAGAGVNSVYRYRLDGRLMVYGGPKYGSPTYGYPLNFGVGGTTLAQIGASVTSSVVPALTPGVKNLVIIQGGTNDLEQSRTALQMIADWQTAVGNAVTGLVALGDGLTHGVVVITTPYLGPSNEAVRLPANAGVRANYASWGSTSGATKAVVILADVGADAMMGSHGTTITTPYFVADGVHPSKIGYERMYAVLAAALATSGF